MWRPLLVSALMFTAGVYIQDRTGILGKYFNDEIKVYADPQWYTVTRTNATINYRAKGERLVSCVHKAPLLADILDDNNNILSRELVRRVANRIKNEQIKEITDDGTVVGTLRVSPEPQKFTVNNYVIVTDVQTLDNATKFVIRSECFNSTDGRFAGLFGPFPIPKDGKSITSFSFDLSNNVK